MRLSATHDFEAPPEKVFASLMDPETLRASLEGCERLDPSGEDAYDAQLRVGVGPVKGTYKGALRITDKKAPESFTLSIEGKGLPGFVRSTARIRLSRKGEGTELQAEGEATVGGVIAAVGSRLVEGIARRMMDDFFRRLAERIR